jgi:hypothetical protein
MVYSEIIFVLEVGGKVKVFGDRMRVKYEER